MLGRFSGSASGSLRRRRTGCRRRTGRYRRWLLPVMSATMVSVALRTPPSNITGVDLCRLHNPGQQLKVWDPTICLATTVIGDVEYVVLLVHLENWGIIGVLIPLYRDLEFGVGTYTTKVFPRQRCCQYRLVVAQGRRRIFEWWFREVFGEVFVGVVGPRCRSCVLVDSFRSLGEQGGSPASRNQRSSPRWKIRCAPAGDRGNWLPAPAIFRKIQLDTDWRGPSVLSNVLHGLRSDTFITA